MPMSSLPRTVVLGAPVLVLYDTTAVSPALLVALSSTTIDKCMQSL